MATTLDQSEPPQPAADPEHGPVLSRRLQRYSSVQEGGLLSDHARHQKIRLHPNDGELAKIREGRDPCEQIEERYDSRLSKQRLLWTVDAYSPRCIFKGETCGWQPPTLQAQGGCQGSILPEPRQILSGHRPGLKSAPAKARPGHIPWPQSGDLAKGICPSKVGNRMHDHVSRGKFDDLADEYTLINIPEEGGTSTMHIPVSNADAEEGGMCVRPARAHRSHGLPGNISGAGTCTMHNPGPCGAFPSGKFALEHQSFDRTQRVHSRSRWTILGDSMLDVIVQGSFALVGLKTSNSSSSAKDTLVRVAVIVYAVGFLSAFGGKLIGSSKLGGIGSGAAVVGFLLTMVMLLL